MLCVSVGGVVDVESVKYIRTGSQLKQFICNSPEFIKTNKRQINKITTKFSCFGFPRKKRKKK